MADIPHASARTASADRDAGTREFEHQLEMLARTLVSTTSGVTAVVSCFLGGLEMMSQVPSRDSRWQALTAKVFCGAE
jgi:hypothetical protein